MFIDFYNEIFNINLQDYENIGINFPINKVLFIITVTLCVACILMDIQRKYTKDLVRQLVRHEATSLDTAKTLEELGLKDSIFIKWQLKSDTSFIRRLVKRVGQTEYTYEEYVELQKKKKLPKEEIDFATAKFYLNENEELRKKHILERYNPSILRTLMWCVLMLAVYICIALLVPEILSLINNSIV